MPRFNDTIAAPATPAGTSAVALVRVSGPDTKRLCLEIFGALPSPRLATRGDYRDRAAVLVDDVLFTFFAEPHTYTGEDALEISCHGNPFIAQRILEDLMGRGCRMANPGEFTQRAFLNGRMDLSEAEAVMDLIHARSERALAAANRQLRGALGRRMEELIAVLLDALARVEAYIDFPEEDLPPEDREIVLGQLERLQQGTERLLATSHYGELLRDGIKTVIVGAPNAGKSSLLNKLIGRERAIVSPEPGTTRDFIEERIVLGPHCLRLIDTAGLNPHPGQVEKMGIERTFERLDEADLVLLVIDKSTIAPDFPELLLARLRPENAVLVLNKADLPAHGGCRVCLPDGVAVVEISALTGDGISRLSELIVKMADDYGREVGEDMIVINARHADALTRARRAVINARAQMDTRSVVTELVASELRDVLDVFGEISGKIDHEQVLDRLFATFCIGK